MSRYRGPAVRKSRRFGAVLFANGQSKQNAFNKRKYPPGVHGRNANRKLSEFGKQLQEKQKARFMFGLTEKQFSRYYEKATRKTGESGLNLLKLLEQRLDNAIFRAGFATTRNQARQISSHGLVTVNGRRINVPSMHLKAGDLVEVRSRVQGSKLFEEVKQAKKSTAPKWINADYGKLKFEVIAEPDRDDVEHLIDIQLIIEYYSK
jgi:small subunit ribosomal protein S4